jgi:protein-tyrosine phosphatase
VTRKLPGGWRALRFRLADKVYGPGTRTTPWTWIGDERIAVGNLPTPESLPALANHEGVTHVVNCRAVPQTIFSGDLDMERGIFGDGNVAHAPMWDHGRRQPAEGWAQAAEFVAEALEDPNARVLIHCQRGRRRSVLVAYAALRLRGRSPEEAAELILAHRKEAHLVPAYRASVEEWLRHRSAVPAEPGAPSSA